MSKSPKVTQVHVNSQLLVMAWSWLKKKCLLFVTSLGILNASDIQPTIVKLSSLIESEFMTNSSKGMSCVMNVHVHALIINHSLDILL